jgi:hypothetical protein
VVPIPAGEHDVEFRFDPASVKLGLGVSASVLVIAIGVLIGAGIRRREAVEP